MNTEIAIPTEILLHRRIKHLEGAIELACGTFTDAERLGKYSQVYRWLRETLRAPIQAKVVDVAQAQDPKMLEPKKDTK